MESTNKKWLAVAVSSLLLAACGGSDDDNDNHGDEHDHDHGHESSVLVSQSGTTTLSLLEEGDLEALDDAAAGNGAQLVLSDNGAYAAVLANTTVNFVHGLHEEEHHEEDEEHSEEEMHDEEEHEHEEAHILEFSLNGSQVISTNGHFAVLNSSTTFVAYDELEKQTPIEESTSSLVTNQAYPGLVLDEEHELKLLFDEDTDEAKVFEADNATPEYTFDCANPSSHAQTHELVVISCDEGALSLLVEEDNAGEHTFDDGTLTLSGTAADYVWRAQDHVIAGFEPESANYAIVELDETQSPAVAEVNQGSHTGGDICALGLDSEASDVLFVTSDAKFVALNHEGEELETITLDFSTESSCDDFVMATASKTAVLIDNNAMKGYEIDVDDPESNPDAYHVHEDFDLVVSDISDMVIFHEMGHDDHEEDHDH